MVSWQQEISNYRKFSNIINIYQSNIAECELSCISYIFQIEKTNSVAYFNATRGIVWNTPEHELTAYNIFRFFFFVSPHSTKYANQQISL